MSDREDSRWPLVGAAIGLGFVLTVVLVIFIDPLDRMLVGWGLPPRRMEAIIPMLANAFLIGAIFLTMAELKGIHQRRDQKGENTTLTGLGRVALGLGVTICILMELIFVAVFFLAG